MLASLLTFGPRAIFTSTMDDNNLPIYKGVLLIEYAQSVLQAYVEKGGPPIKSTSFPFLRKHFLLFLQALGFSKANLQNTKAINWVNVYKTYQEFFNLDALAYTLAADIEAALAEQQTQAGPTHSLAVFFFFFFFYF